MEIRRRHISGKGHALSRGRGRLVAPDLIGMGDSDRLPDSEADRYRFVEHREYLDELLERMFAETCW